MMTKKSCLRYGSLALIVLSLSACATITRGSRQNVEFKSSPEGAKVSTTTGENCITPCTMKMRRKASFDATFTKEGYEPQITTVKSKGGSGGAVAAAFGNVVFGGLIGIIVDATTGSLKTLKPGKLDVTMVPAGSAVSE
jgi:hypothetical protein